MNTAADITNERCVVCWGIEHKHHFAQLTLGTIATAAFLAAQMSGGGATRNGVTAENALIGLNLNALHLEGTTTTTEPVTYERYIPPRPSRSSGGSSVPKPAPIDIGSNRAIGRKMMLAFWGEDQWPCLDDLWGRLESGWNQYADNPNSSAYGIPQALPGSKMASAGSDWRTNPATQIEWGLPYIQGTYNTPCEARTERIRKGWY